MSIERLFISPGSKGDEEEEISYEQQIEKLLGKFPTELRKRWEEEIEGINDADAVALLRSVIGKRLDTRTAILRGESEGADPSKLERAQALRDKLLKNEVVLGSGGVADVVADPTNPGVCYKIIRDHGQYMLCNNIVQEGDFLEELSNFSYAGIRTPRAVNTVVAPEFVALGMERLPGMSLEQMLTLPELPENFNISNYFNAMREYVDKLLKERHVYHRDLRPGNMMFDPETGAMFLIDFGRSVHAYEDEKGFLEFQLQQKLIRSRNTNKEKLDYIESAFRTRYR